MNMAKRHEVLSRLKYGGRVYEPGSFVSIREDEIAEHLVANGTVGRSASGPAEQADPSVEAGKKREGKGA